MNQNEQIPLTTHTLRIAKVPVLPCVHTLGSDNVNAGIKPEMTGREADALARDVIAARGYGKRFGHGLGHSVGLAVHEEPRMGMQSSAVLRPGNTLTVEPGIYITGWGGVRIEDLVVVTDTGIEVLSKAGKGPVVPVG